MDCKEIESLLTQALSLDEAHVTTDSSHFKVIAVGECFDGMSRIKQQQAVYGPLMEHITSGALHAVTIKTFTPTQWKREKVLNMPM
ncbi:MAG: BolA family transcriptional regulator [Shewanella sp.]|nr:BolA family transcriptional regulator [Shewanella sp.]MCF1429382.1 BolA family transcriptional regulator [Shewanella sp.]MCF1438941.1 BolA family transcriptional regulator [Shewanella sp.]MCF1456046.1 BolA family transcriptional regulator [Shewanella sp.]